MIINKMEQRRVVVQLLVKKLASIFYSIFRVFMTLNLFILGLTFYIMIATGSGVGVFLFIVFFVNFWSMLIFFGFLSMCVKLFICMLYEDVMVLDENYSWIMPIVFFPLVSEETEDDFVQLIAQQSMDTQEPTRDTPTTEKLDGLENRWGSIWQDIIPTEDKMADQCLICSNSYDHVFPSHTGCISIGCCSNMFHKKCLLEWLYFSEKQQQEDESKWMVSCPSCRHVFVQS